MGTFLTVADGLQQFFTRGKLTNRTRLTESRANIILDIMRDDMSKTADMFDTNYEQWMITMSWICHEIRKIYPKLQFPLEIDTKTKLTARMGSVVVNDILCNYKHEYWLCFNEQHIKYNRDFVGAFDWLSNKVYSRYSNAEIALSD